jgi:Zn-dependent protease with chaperone function
MLRRHIHCDAHRVHAIGPMLTNLPAAAFLAALVALTPAILRVWFGLPLVRNTDDAALAERLEANQRRNTQITAACCAILLVGWTSSAVWTIPLLVVARLIAAYPLRKQLYSETWTLGEYVSFFGRLTIAMLGFWILLALLPYIAQQADSRDWMVAALLGTGLLMWNSHSARLLRWMLRARPLTDAVLLSRFEAMVAASGIPMPRFDYVDLRGGVLANAVAVPSLHGSGVIFTDTLLARLDTNEIVAICAHELAHLEHYHPRRLRRLRAATAFFVVMGAALAPIAQWYLPGERIILTGAVWPVGLLLFLMWLARDRQRNETASDLRAVDLCGNAETLARALTKLYTFARVPRRWTPDRERQATHPSLARRLRDIRAAGGGPSTSVDAPARIAGTDGRTVVTFDRTHVSWQEGDTATHSFNYTHLSELRLDAGTSGAARLVAVEGSGRRWQMTVADRDVAHVQQVLDLVDGSLSPPPAALRLTPAVVRLFTVIASLIGWAAGQFAFALVGLLAAGRLATPLLAAAGVAALTAAVLTLRDAQEIVSTHIAIMLAVLGASLFAIGWTNRRDAPAHSPALPMLLLAALASAACAMLFSYGVNPVRLHQAARANDAAPVLLFALAGAMASMRARVWRYVAGLAVAPALLAIVAGSTLFLERIGRDPFLVSAEPLALTFLRGSPISEYEAAFDVGDLRLSPHGASIAISRSGEGDDSSEEVSTFHIGPAKGPLTVVKADDLAFIDDGRVVTMSAREDGADVRAVRVDNPQSDTWHVHVDGVRQGTLSIDAARGRWQILGWDRSRRIIRAQGRVGDAAVEVMHWNGFAPTGAWVNATATSGTTLLAVDKRYDRGIFGGAMLRSWYLPFMAMHNESRVWRVTPEIHSQMSTSLLDTDCTAHVLADQLVCTAYDGTRTGILRVDAATATAMSIASIAGRFIAYGSRSPGWLTGWLDSTPAAFRVTTRDAVRVTAYPPPTSIAAGADAIGTISNSGERSLVRVYRYY